MARNDFEFPSLNHGEFFRKVFDSGKVMVGWGRTGRSKFVQLDQTEIVKFLAAAPEMIRTDDTVLIDLLGQVAKHLAASAPLTLTQLSALAATSPEIGPRFADIMAGAAAGQVEAALEILTRELREAGTI